MKLRQPRSTAAATALLDRRAAVESVLAVVEANRAKAVADTNAVGDSLAMPLIEEMAAIDAALEPWWASAGPALTGGKRKSIELGGCTIGTRAKRTSLTVVGDEEALVTLMQTLRWAKPFVRVRHSIDRTAALIGLDGKYAAGLADIGFAKAGGGEEFFVKRIATGAGETVARG